MKKVAVLQSNYIPWKGYFDIIHDVDEFIFYDEVQYTIRDWRSRNKIIINKEPSWITVPTGSNVRRNIVDVQLNDNRWQVRHYKSIMMAYSRTRFFKKYHDFIYDAYINKEWKYLYELNRYMIMIISKDFLGITAKFSDSRDYNTHGVKHEKLLSLVKSANADIYVSGPAAKEYIISSDYEKAGIDLVWKDYSGYPEYTQQSTNFTHYVSILDLLFNVGDDAPYYIWGWRS